MPYRSLILVLVVMLTAVLSPPASGSAQAWGERADEAIARAEVTDDGTGRPFHYAFLASAVGLRYGWDDPRALAYLERVLDARNPDGGWGIGEPWDVFQDGSTNEADVTYTVTLAGHVGPPLLEAWQAGVVPVEVVTGLVDSVLATPLVPGVRPGMCVSYSHAPSDARLGHCVHNVNMGVAAFLADVEAAGVTHRLSESRRWRAGILAYETATYLPSLPGWRYSDTSGRANDADHTGYQTESAMTLTPQRLGLPSLRHYMARDMGPRSWLGHITMGRYACGSIDRWLGEYDAAIGAEGFGRQAQAARYTALIAKRCEGAAPVTATAATMAGETIDAIASCGLAGGSGTVESWGSANVSSSRASTQWRWVIVTNSTGRHLDARVRAFAGGVVVHDVTAPEGIPPGWAEWFVMPEAWFHKSLSPYARVDLSARNGRARHWVGITPSPWSECYTWSA